MFALLTVLKSRLGITAIAVLLLAGILLYGKHKMENLEEGMFIARQEAIQSETLRAECNRNVRAMNADIELRAAISELDQIERDKLLETVDDLRFQNREKVAQNRKDARESLRDIDCAGVDVPAVTQRMLSHAVCAANQRVCD